MKKIIILVAAISLMFTSCEKPVSGCLDSGGENYDSKAELDCECCVFNVVYTVTGGSTYNVTYKNEDGNTAQASGVSSGWSYEFEPTSENQWVYLSAQNQENSGNVVVEITYKKEIWESTTSTGGYVIATASGNI